MGVTRLPSGIYLISRKSDGMHVGRSLQEEVSLAPKAVIIIPTTPERGAPRWSISPGSNGRYVLQASGAPVESANDKLVANLVPNKLPAEWILTPQPDAGHDVFTIETRDRQYGWILPEDGSKSSQVAVGPTAIQKHALFKITPVAAY